MNTNYTLHEAAWISLLSNDERSGDITVARGDDI